jgi:hypothetical protein
MNVGYVTGNQDHSIDLSRLLDKIRKEFKDPRIKEEIVSLPEFPLPESSPLLSSAKLG